MKTPFTKIILTSFVLSLGAAVSQAANISLVASDPGGSNSFTTGASWSNLQPPNPTNDYFSAQFFLRTPTGAGNFTFAGNSLTLQTPSGQNLPNRSLLYKGGGGNIYTISNLIMNGGVIDSGSGNIAAPTFTGTSLTIAGNSSIQADQGSFIIGYPVFGSANLTNSGNSLGGGGTGKTITYTGSLSNFTGKFVIANFGGGETVALNPGTTIPGNPTNFVADQIQIALGCTLIDNAGLAFTNSNTGITIIGNAAVVNLNAAAATLIGDPITDVTNGASSLALLNSGGGGTLILSNANNNWSGGTTIAAGVLQLGVDNAIPGNSTNGSVTDNAELDLNGHNLTINGLNGIGVVDTSSGGTPTLTIGANGTGGAINGPIQNSAGALSLVKVGAGTQTITNYTYSGTTLIAGGTLNLITSGSLPGSPGDMVLSNGAVLNVNSSGGVSLPVNNLVVGTNTTLNVTANAGANAINANAGITFQDNAINNLTYGTVAANPTGLFINAVGGISAPGTNIVINISATGLQIGAFTLIKYTGTPLASIANFTLNPPPGVAAVLVNDTTNSSIDVQITAIPNTLSWYGTGGGSWDLTTPNWSNDIAGGTTVFQQYTNNGVVAGDSVTFDDTLTNSSPPPTNITLNSTFFAFPVVFNSTNPYSISGTGGIAGPTSLLVTNTGSFTLLTSNSFTGGVMITGGGTLVIPGDSAMGTNRGLLTLNGGALQINGSFTNNLRPVSVPAESTIGVSAGNSVRLGGRITGTTLDTTNSGTLVLGGSNIYSGDLFLHQGTVIIDSGANVTNLNYDDVGQNSNDVATLTLQGTGSLSTASDFNAGDLGNSIGTVNISGSASLVANALFIGSANATGSTASGTVNQTGGTVTQLNVNVGECVIGGRITNALGGGVGLGVYNMSGGTFTPNGNVRLGAGGIGTLNQSGGIINAIRGINIARLPNSIGTNNLNGGTNATFNLTSSTGANAVFNFNGGTLQAQFAPANPWFFGGIQANILANGAFIDSSTNNAVVNTPLLAGSPNGGLTKLGSGTLTLNGSNTFTGPITNSAGTLVLNSTDTYPGIVVVNAGTVSLTAPNTLQGGANINAGTLQMTPASLISGTTTIKTNATLSIVQTGSSTVNLGNLTFNGVANVPGASLAVTLSSANVATVPFINAGTVTLNGSNTINMTGALPLGPTALIQYSGAIAGSGNITNLVLPQGASGYISNNVASSTLYVVVTNSGPGIVWKGTNSAAGKTNVWDILSTTNWLVNGIPTWYQQFAIPGDAVTFNDSGSGTVLLSNNVGPASIVISNSAKNYTFNGTGLITGTTGITKLGTGTAIINLSNNNYSGTTTVSNGTLQVGALAALSPNGNLTLGPSGTLEMAGFPVTAGELAGSGLIDNNSGFPKALTIGTSSGGTWNGTITNTGLGGVALTKNGTGTWVIGGSNYLNDGQPFGDHVFVNAGTLELTNGGLLSISQLELRIADGNAENNATSSVVVAGGTLIVPNNPLTVGLNTNASGTLIVNSGTIIAGAGGAGLFAESPNGIVVGGTAATGTMIVNGGQVIDAQVLLLGQDAGASGTLDLNGGLLQVNSITNSGGPTTSVANFNGGTLQAATNNPDFLNPGPTYNVLSNGLVLDDNGFTLNITAGLQPGDAFSGGLIKKGAGTVYLDAGSSYIGATVVTNGSLGGVGFISGPLVVGPAGNLAPGDAGANVGGPFAVNSNMTLNGFATFRISVNASNAISDQVNGITAANYGGILVVSNVTIDSSVMTNGETFQLFNAASATGNFSSIVGSPGVAGLSYVFYPATGVLGVTNAVVVKSSPRITHISVSGTTLNISGTNGTASGSFVLLGSTNVALPVAQWTPLLTNSFDGSGNFNLSTNIVNPSVPFEFYILSQ